MSTFTIDNKSMHFLDKGEGPVLVFGHSYLWDSAMWAPQVDALSQHYRCIVPDLWSHGQSDSAPEKHAHYVITLMMFWHCLTI